MAIRDTLVIAIILLAAPVTLFNPYFGVLMWTWIAYFNPHRYAWGASQVRLFPARNHYCDSYFGRLAVRAEKHPAFSPAKLFFLAALWFWFAFTTFYISLVPEFAGHVADATLHLEEVSKILLMTFRHYPARHFARKSFAASGARHSGEFRVQSIGRSDLVSPDRRPIHQVWGPEGSFLYDNNDFGLALNMTIPMFFFMARAEPKLWMRVGLRCADGVCHHLRNRDVLARRDGRPG